MMLLNFDKKRPRAVRPPQRELSPEARALAEQYDQLRCVRPSAADVLTTMAAFYLEKYARRDA